MTPWCQRARLAPRVIGPLPLRLVRGQPLWTFDPCGRSGNPSIMDPMWIDDRGSEVLTLPECHRLLAIGAKEHRHGHLGVPKDGAPLVLPVDYAVHGPDVVLRIGEGLFHQVDARLVAFQVDGVTSTRRYPRGISPRPGACSYRVWRSRITRTCRRPICRTPRSPNRVRGLSASEPTLSLAVALRRLRPEMAP